MTSFQFKKNKDFLYCFLPKIFCLWDCVFVKGWVNHEKSSCLKNKSYFDLFEGNVYITFKYVFPYVRFQNVPLGFFFYEVLVI